MAAKRKKAPLSVSVTEPPAGPKSSAAGREVQLSWEGVKVVQKKIERCLELYMTQVGDEFATIGLFFACVVAPARANERTREYADIVPEYVRCPRD